MRSFNRISSIISRFEKANHDHPCDLTRVSTSDHTSATRLRFGVTLRRSSATAQSSLPQNEHSESQITQFSVAHRRRSTIAHSSVPRNGRPKLQRDCSEIPKESFSNRMMTAWYCTSDDEMSEDF